MDQNESEYGSMLLFVYPRYSCGYSYVWNIPFLVAPRMR